MEQATVMNKYITLMKEMLYAVRCLKSKEDNYDPTTTQQVLAQQIDLHSLCDFIAQLVRALHRHRRGHGFESR